ncbi:MAG: hypothetical protein ABIK47_04645 [candidate division WOR-3 bacterium]
MMQLKEPLIRGRDYFGPIKVSRFLLDTNLVIFLDVDGDRKPDTLEVQFLQIQWCLRIRAHKSEVILALTEDEALFYDTFTDIYAEVATAFLTNEEKPLLLVAKEVFPALGNQFWIYDVVHTARGLNAETLLNVPNAGWANSPVLIKPGYVEIQHFRNWTIAKYIWDGDKFIEVPVPEK